MNINLPSTKALQAFEAASRHLNYSRAADELHLTHGAISHHIARLEEDLGGIRLFVRDGQSMMLTPAGQTFAINAGRALRALGDAVKDARSSRSLHREQRPLAISVLPSFAAHWLVPRLQRLQELCPGIELSIQPSGTLAALNGHDGIDLAIRYGSGRWNGVRSEKLSASLLSPVSSAAFRDRERIVRDDDIGRTKLLRNPRQKWAPWFEVAGLPADEPDVGPIYEDAGLLLDAAANGQGVALARLLLAADMLNAGRLVRLSTTIIEDDYGWFLSWREPLRCDPAVFEALRHWLLKECIATSESISH